MARTLVKTAKTVEAALSAALSELGAQAEDVDYEVLERPSKGLFGFLGGRAARVRVTLKEPRPHDAGEAAAPPEGETASSDGESGQEEAPQKARPAVDPSVPLARAEKLLNDIFSSMHMEVGLERTETEDGYVYSLVGKDLGILIGKHGQTLDALQYLVNLAANRGLADDRVRVILDVENYRRRREETLRRLASRLADKVRRIHEEIKLEPMNRHERKIIHMALQDNRAVTTYSDGDEPYRYVVIAPKRRERYDRHEQEA